MSTTSILKLYSKLIISDLLNVAKLKLGATNFMLSFLNLMAV